MGDRLGPYRAKRDFDATPEPAPAEAAGEEGRRYVVQEHHARSMHWDLRLEHGGALASWAVPNGIPDDPKHNRKAVRTPTTRWSTSTSTARSRAASTAPGR